MSSGTRIALALIAIFVGVLVVYYGFVMPTSDAPPTGDALSSLPPPEKPREKTDDARAMQGHERAAKRPVSRPVKPEVVMGEPTARPRRPGDSASTPPATSKPLTAARTGRLDAGPGSATSTPPRARPDSEPTDSPVAPPIAPPTRPQPTIYTVKDGDTMSSIAIRWFGDELKWHLIAKANPLVDPSRLRIGQVLHLPPRGTPRGSVPPPAPGRASAYTVRSGDTLSTIALEVYGSGALWKSIYAANRARIGSDPDRLVVGMELVLPPKP